MNNTVVNAIKNTVSNTNVYKMTLGAAWQKHGPVASASSRLLGIKAEKDLLPLLCALDWKESTSFPGGHVYEAELPPFMEGEVKAIPAESVDQDATVIIDLSIDDHPSAILLSGGDCQITSVLTLIIEDQAETDPDLAGTGAHGPIVATWFPGRSTPPSKPDGVLKHGDSVSVAEARQHGFGTVVFK